MFALSQGSEAVEDCVQGALSSLYPPFESTAPPLLSQVSGSLRDSMVMEILDVLQEIAFNFPHLEKYWEKNKQKNGLEKSWNFSLAPALPTHFKVDCSVITLNRPSGVG